MGKSKQKIRVLALGWIRKDDRLLLSEGYDPKKGETFYRALGGGVDFGETSFAALQREFVEELQAELTNIQYLGCIESTFVYKDKPGHEVIQLYQCDLVDSRFYEMETVPFQEGKRQKKALWVEIEKLRSKELKLVPEGCLNYL